MDLHFTEKDPTKGYISNNLLIPKTCGLVPQIKTALTFTYGEEDIIDPETREVVGTKQSTLRLWDETKHHLIVPREFLDEKERKNYKIEFVDLRTEKFETTDLEDHIILRDQEQEEAFQALLDNPSGTLNISCGKGKSVLALKLAATLKVPTIIIVNTTALLEQWKEEAQLHLGVKDVGIVQGDVAIWDKHPIVLAMIHTLANRRDQWPIAFRKRFGLVIGDEIHHTSAPVFVRSADLFFGKRYGLTATATRTDGMESIYQYHLGRVLHANLSQDLVPTTVFHKLKWTASLSDKESVTDVSGQVNLSMVRSFLGGLDWRNEIIYRDIVSDLDQGRSILVLSHSIEHVRKLCESLESRGAGMITGETPQDQRMDILRNCNPVCGTFQLAREGLNKPELDTLYIATPFANSNDMQQSWGRIQRRYADKEKPLVRVYEDTAFNCCVKSCRGLRKNLKTFGYPHEVINLDIGDLNAIPS
jgi:superfamily II DNA or RNA helicase